MRKSTILYCIFLMAACKNPSQHSATSSRDTVAAAVNSPAQVSVKGGSEVLYMYKWTLTELNGESVKLDNAERIPQLAFFPGQVNRVTGTSGCNRVNGTFDIGSGNLLKFLPLATTKMACIGDNLESQFLQGLAEVDQFSIAENDTLLLLRKGVISLKFAGKAGS